MTPVAAASLSSNRYTMEALAQENAEPRDTSFGIATSQAVTYR